MIKKRLLLPLLILLFQSNLLAQLKIDQLNSGFDQLKDSLFLGITKTRSIENLNNSWKVFFVNEPENKSIVSFPVKFTFSKTVVFEKEFNISSYKVNKNLVQLNFLGLNYSAEIYLNNATIYKHAGGEVPFSIDLNENMLNYDLPNTLRIKIQYDIHGENTIPTLQRFLFPTNFGGIFRDVYLAFRPKVGIKDINYSLSEDTSPFQGKLSFSVLVENLTKSIPDSLKDNLSGKFKIQASIKLNHDSSSVFFNTWDIDTQNNPNYKLDFFVRLKEIINWKTDSPISYIVSLKLLNNNGHTYDEITKSIAMVDLDKVGKSLRLNNENFTIKGVTYIRSSSESVSNYSRIEKDIKTIKDAGFNTVRFSKVIPHPYAVFLCEKYGLFSLIELPLNSIPENFASDNNFRNRAISFISRINNYFDKYNTVVGYGSGGSYISSSDNHSDFLSLINKTIRKNSPNKLTYSSFFNYSQNISITNLDLFGLELYAEDPAMFVENFSNSSPSDSSVYFISEATYPNYKGATNGYLNEFSYEGQAKFFDGVIDATYESNIKGFVLNSMFDYQGDFSPLFAGFDKENIYSIGILSSEEDESRLSFNLVKSKLTNGTKTAIPIGNSVEDSSLLFIISALLISIIIALLINSKRKFREDATRALLRPYNFYSDIRDQRILTSFHSNILLFLLSGANALLFTIIFYYLKDSILFEKIVIAFGSYKLSSIISYLAWNPEEAFIYFFIASIVLFLATSIVFQISSFFVKNRVLYSSVYSVAIWSFLPLALLVPLEAVLYKLLQIETYNIIIYVVLFLFLIWNIQRFLKGIYVIFDIRPFTVYFFSFLIFGSLVFATLFYFQYTTRVFDYINIAFKQFALL